ncbi:serine hydrolase domain-containing protein [Polaribacter porphyrae]|uniref:Beta-lactamase-related domain-containing protein n=1 Tax=Polaribacter porphyrae TaxID=1137780 RepID=A0A2S7WM54_9FLAO|nr:serine hydrolase domain-containing protein [Polaribacter porphyrae]PQJ78680.1 hypothetical protein BTO18_05535 [Polaribacter porphyrae]
MKKVILVIICVVTIASCKQKNIQIDALSNDKKVKIDSLLTLLNQQNQFNGNVLIVQKGKEILKKSYGDADIEHKQKLNENSVFELASVSKQFTATGIVLLKLDNKLKYSDKVTKYFPELTFCKNVTIQNLLNHSSGIPDYIGMMIRNWDKSKIAVNNDVVKLLSEKVDTLNFAPKAKFQYSNSNYLLLASIIEKVSGKTYADYLSQHIFQPLKMNNSSVLNRRYKPTALKNYAYGYILDDNQNKVLPDSTSYSKYVVYLDGIVGDGMVNSTTNDLRKWDKSLRDYVLIPKDEFEKIISLDTLSNGKVNTYSFGWRIKKSEDGLSMSHSGGWPGYITYISRDIDSENLIVILQNFGNVVVPVKTIKEILNNQPISKTYKKEIILPEKILKKYLGEYVDKEDSNSITTLTLGKNSLIYNSTNNQWNMPFFPESNNLFFSKSQRLNIGFKFTETETGKIKLIFMQNNKKIGESIKK